MNINSRRLANHRKSETRQDQGKLMYTARSAEISEPSIDRSFVRFHDTAIRWRRSGKPSLVCDLHLFSCSKKLAWSHSRRAASRPCVPIIAPTSSSWLTSTVGYVHYVTFSRDFLRNPAPYKYRPASSPKRNPDLGALDRSSVYETRRTVPKLT